MIDSWQLITYKSGASYEGRLSRLGTWREGSGTLELPSGVRYEGEFKGNKRHGKGVQVWSSGERYEGEFEEDQRHGKGWQSWPDGEQYEGQFVSDCRSGQGVYMWPDGASYTGSFMSDKKHGHGIFMLASGNRFEGEYCEDKRCGHGVMTYPDGSQDVGLWQGEQLIKLYSRVPGISPGDPDEDETGTKSRAVDGERGPLEMASEQLIILAVSGNTVQLQGLVERGDVCVDVADSVGCTALMAAAKHCHLDIINILLDNGADINKLNNAGASALTMCYHQLYEKVACQHEPSREPELPERAIQLRDDGDGRAHEGAGQKDVADMKFLERMSRMGGWVSAGYHTDTEHGESCGEERPRERGRSDSGMGRDESRCEESDEENGEVGEEASRQSGGQIDNEVALYGWRSPAQVRSTIHLLLTRGADPNCSCHPLPPLFFTIRAKDLPASRFLLKKGASATMTLSAEDSGEAPLHAAVKLNGQRVIRLVELLLRHGADANQRICSDTLGDPFQQLERRRASIQTVSSTTSGTLTGPDDNLMTQTALHVVCARLDDFKLVTSVVSVLLKHGADPNLTAHGHSALSLAIGSGNDETVYLLLQRGADPNLPLGRGVGSALCAVTALHSQRRRSPEASILMISRLVECGANILIPIRVSMKIPQGTAVDFAHTAFNRDKHISQLPYHALTKDERLVFRGRMKVLQHMANILRDAARAALAKQLVELNQQADEVRDGGLSPELRCETSASGGDGLQCGYSMSTISELELEAHANRPPPRMPMFTTVLSHASEGYTKRHAKQRSSVMERTAGTMSLPALKTIRSISVPAVSKRKSASFISEQAASSFSFKTSPSPLKQTEPHVDIARRSSLPASVSASSPMFGSSLLFNTLTADARSSSADAFCFCDYCGRSGGVRLIRCHRCKRVYYCSRDCKIKGWEARHGDECVLVRDNEKVEEASTVKKKEKVADQMKVRKKKEKTATRTQVGKKKEQ